MNRQRWFLSSRSSKSAGETDLKHLTGCISPQSRVLLSAVAENQVPRSVATFSVIDHCSHVSAVVRPGCGSCFTAEEAAFPRGPVDPYGWVPGLSGKCRAMYYVKWRHLWLGFFQTALVVQ